MNAPLPPHFTGPPTPPSMAATPNLNRADAAPVLPVVGGVYSYVVLHHSGVPDEHFDLLLDVGPGYRLMTWRVQSAPTEWMQGDLAALRIGDHRRIYLTFEGAIAGNRGSVRQVAVGQATVIASNSTSLRLHITRHLRQEDGTFTDAAAVNVELPGNGPARECD